jgi:hypothetical protein
MAPLLDRAPAWVTDLGERCESPIEQVFACALGLATLTVDPTKRPTIAVQVPIKNYRADLVITGPHGAPRIVVECDGTEFHKDTKKDAKRTAAIEELGYRVVRVTGSEIHHNPLARARALLREVGF